MNRRETRNSSPPNYEKSKRMIWNRFKRKILASFRFIFVLILSLSALVVSFEQLSSLEGSEIAEAATVKEPFKVTGYYTIEYHKVLVTVSGFLVNGSLSHEDDVKIVVFNPPDGVPDAGIETAFGNNQQVGVTIMKPNAVKVGTDYVFTFTNLASTELFSQDGTLEASVGGAEIKLTKDDNSLIPVEAIKLQINYVDTDGNPLTNPPKLSEVPYTALQENSDDIFDGKVGRLDGQIANTPEYSFKLDQSTLSVPKAASPPDLKSSIEDNGGSLFEGVRAILDDPEYGGGQIIEGSKLTLVYQVEKPTATVDVQPATFTIGDRVTREQLVKATIQNIALSNGISATDYENLIFSSSVTNPDGSVDTSKKGIFDVDITYKSDEIQKSVTVTTKIDIIPVFRFTEKYVDENGKELHPQASNAMGSENGFKLGAFSGLRPQFYGSLPSIEKSKFEIKQDGKVVKPEKIDLTNYGSDWKMVIKALEDEIGQLSSNSSVNYAEFIVTYVYEKPTATITTNDLTVDLNGKVNLQQLITGIKLSSGTTITDYSKVTFTNPIIKNNTVDTSKQGNYKITVTYTSDDIQGDATATATIHVLPEIKLVTNYVDEKGNELKYMDSPQPRYGSEKQSFAVPDPIINGLIPSFKKSTLREVDDGIAKPPADVFNKNNWSDIIDTINGGGLTAKPGISSTTYTLTYVYVPQQTAVLTIDGQTVETVKGEADDTITFAKTAGQLIRGGYSYMVKGPDNKQYNSLSDALKANDKYDHSTVTVTGEDSHKQVFEVVYKQIPQTGITLKNQSLIPLVVVSIVGLTFFVFRKLKKD